MSDSEIPPLFDDIDTIRIPATATWLPRSLRRRLERQECISYGVKFSKAERKIYRKRTPLPLSQWSEKHRVLTMSSLPGPWRNEATPYLPGIMDASTFPGVQVIILCKGPQMGGSEIAHNFVGGAIDQQPGPVLYVYPDEQTTKDNSRDRILPMINSSPRLRSYLTGVQDDASVMRISLKHMPIYMAWATSPNRLANKPIRYLILDEIDKYPETSGKRETSSIALAEMRTNTFSDSRVIWKISTPTVESGNIWVALNKEAQVVFDFWVVCPHCETLQLMDFDRIKWPKGERDPETIEASRLAGYDCSGCPDSWDDEARDRAVRKGYWRARGSHLELFVYLNAHRPKKIGFHLPAWLSRFVSLSEIAADFLRGAKDKKLLKKFMNQRKAEPWIDYAQDRKEDLILSLRNMHLPRGIVPSGDVAALTIGIDTQDVGYYYRITAWGYGMNMGGHMVAEGKVENEDALEEVLYREYCNTEGDIYMVVGGFIDTQGHRVSEVYDWTRLHQNILPCQGKSSRGGAAVSWNPIDYYPGTKVKIPGGLNLYSVDTIFYKDMLSSKLEIKRDDPGAYLFHNEIDEGYAAQMCVEYRDEKGIWQCPKNKDNHYWDVSVYDLAYAHYLGIRTWPMPDPAQQQAAAGGGRRVRSQGLTV
jgi:phage terminase large subunit GpA-like protein